MTFDKTQLIFSKLIKPESTNKNANARRKNLPESERVFNIVF